jgi:hypothetical protein
VEKKKRFNAEDAEVFAEDAKGRREALNIYNETMRQ